MIRFLLILAAVSLQTKSFASHILGLDLYYTYVSGSTYKITLIAYGDCAGSAFPTLSTSAPVVCIYDGSTSVGSVTLAIQVPTSGVEISPVCAGTVTQCTSASSTVPGIKKFVYSANYTLPHTSSVWRFVFTGNMGAASAGRSASVTNILSGTFSQIEDTLNNTVHSNSNPILTVLPTPYYCLNNTDVYNPGAVDADGDRLLFSLIPGMNGTASCSPGSPVTYVGTAWPGTPVSGATPLQVATGTFSFNPLTGQISFYPNVTQRSLIVYNVREFRSDTFIGSCQREMNFLVQACTTSPPTGSLTSATAGTILDSTDFQICSGTGAYSIYMDPTEADTSNLITVTSSGLPAGATFTTTGNGTRHPHCTFSWTTTGVAPGTYVFYVTFTDNNCPINGTQTRAYTITVLPNPVVTASGRTSFCVGGSATLTAAGSATGYVWSGAGLSCTTCSSTTARPTVTTLYTVSTTGTCTTRDTVRVTVNPLPTVDAGTPTNICPGNSISLTPTGASTYVWSGTGLSCTSCTSPVVSPSVTTVYTVTGTDANGCVNTDTIRITVGLPIIDAGAPVSICPGSSGTLSASGGSTYTWSPGTGLSCTACANPSAAPSATTVYTVTGRDAFGCTNTDTVRVTVNTRPTIDAGASVSICIGSSTTLTASGGSTYVWSGPGLSCSTCTSPTAIPATSSIYTVIGTDIHGCTGSDTVHVTVILLPPVDASPHATVCAGTSTTLSASGASRYVWSPGTGLSCTSCTSPTATPSGTIIYTVTGTGVGGCTNSDTVSITVHALPSISGGGSHTVCGGSSATLTGTGGISYTWAPGATLSCTSCSSPVATPTSTTLYTVTGTDAFGCTNIDTVRVTVDTRPTIDAGAPVSLCIGSSTTLTASGGSSYVWSGPGLSCSACTSPTATPTTTTIYTVTGTDSHGCTGSDTVRVTVNLILPVDAGPHTSVCAGASTTLSASGATAYVWSPGTGLSCTSCASPTATPSGTIIYTVTGTGVGGCTNRDTVSITVNPLPSIIAGGSYVLCRGGSTTLSASGGASYVWTPAGTLSCSSCSSPTATPASTTLYTVTGTSAFGCTNWDTVRVTVNPLPTIDAGAPVSLCIGSSTTLTASGGSSYVWSGPGLSCSACTSPTATPTTTTIYTVTGTDSHGCTGYDTVSITVNLLPPVDAGPHASVCAGASTTLSASGAGSYVWSPGTGLSCTSCANPTATPSGTIIYTVTGTGAGGCTNRDTVSITVNPLPSIIAGGGYVLCRGGSTTLSASGGASYVWTPAGTLSCSSCSSPTATPASTTLYTVTGTSAFGCTNWDTVRVTVNPLPTIDAGAPIRICIGSSATLTPSGGSTYVWSGPGLSCSACTSPTATPTTTSIYTVTGTDIHGCTASDTVRVTVNLLPLVDAGPHATVCAGSSSTLSASGATTYVWSPGTGLSCTSCASPTATPGGTTIYTVTGTGVGGCTNTDTVSITVNPLPVIIAGGRTTICGGGIAVLGVSGGTSYVWTPAGSLSCSSCSSTFAHPSSTTLYTVTGTSAFGCTNRDTVRVTVVSSITVSVPDISICTGSSGVLMPTGATTYVWSASSSLSCTACTSPTASPATTTTYTVIGRTSVCRDTATVTVTVNPLPIITTISPGPKCAGQSDTLIAMGGIRYTWAPAAGLSCATCALTTATPATTTIYTVTGYNSFGCGNTALVAAIIYSLPAIAVAPAPAVICYGSDIPLTASGAISYSWAPTTGLSAATGPTVIASPSSTIVYTVTGTDANNCVNTATEIVTVNPIPPPPTASPVSYCQNSTATALTATGTGLLWYTTSTGGTGSAIGPVPSTATLGATTYYVSQTVNGCESPRIPVVVMIYTNAHVDFDFQVKPGCLTDTVTFTSTSHDVSRLVWSFGDGSHDTASTVVHYYPAPAREGTYYTVMLHGYNPSCLDDSITKNVALPVVHKMELHDVTLDQAIRYGTSIQLNASGADYYFWMPNDGTLNNNNINNPIATPKTDETYIVYGRIKEGCQDTAVVHITIIYPEGEVVPSAFSPNGDGLNDVFRIINLGFDKLDEFRIYNRWGQVVFVTADMNQGWDGTFLGVEQEIGAYYYMINISRANGEKKLLKGDFTLIR